MRLYTKEKFAIYPLFSIDLNYIMNLAIIGATGNVGRKILEVLEQKGISINKIHLVASKKSANKKINFCGEEYRIQELEKYDFSQAEITFFAAGGKISQQYAEKRLSLQQ